jgi:hypothetical protein
MAAVNKLTQPRRAMQLTVLANAVVFFGIAMAIVVSTIDAHWVALVLFVVAFLFAVFAVGPVAYAIEQRPHHHVRLHRAVGVVDLDAGVDAPLQVHRRWYALVLRANGKTYRLFKTIGNASVVDEWLRRASR